MYNIYTYNIPLSFFGNHLKTNNPHNDDPTTETKISRPFPPPPAIAGAAEAARAGAAPGGGLAGGGRLGALGGVGHAEAIEAELDELTRVNSQLRGEMVVKSASWGEEKGALERALTSARESLSGASAEAATLRKDLVGRPAMSEVRSLKQQVRALQQLEFNGGNDDEVGVEGNSFLSLLPCWPIKQKAWVLLF